MVGKVKELGLETCATLGLLRNDQQAEKLKQSGIYELKFKQYQVILYCYIILLIFKII